MLYTEKEMCIRDSSMVIMYSVGMKRMGPYYQSAQKMNNTIIEYITAQTSYPKIVLKSG